MAPVGTASPSLGREAMRKELTNVPGPLLSLIRGMAAAIAIPVAVSCSSAPVTPSRIPRYFACQHEKEPGGLGEGQDVAAIHRRIALWLAQRRFGRRLR